VIAEHSAEIDGHLVVWRQAGDAPILWLHGVPDSGELWTPFLERAGGIAPDLPGFGRSGKRADFPYSIDGYAAFLARFCEHVGLQRVRLVAHDWGSVGLAMAARRPDLVDRIVAVNVVPFVEGFRWHWMARVWRRRLMGEIAMGFSSRRVARRVARGMTDEQLDRALAHFDHGTQRAILRLYRSADPDVVARAGDGLEDLDVPALVVWGEDDPYLDSRYASLLGERLRAKTVAFVSGAGHWSWAYEPAAQERILEFVTARTLAGQRQDI
jgi:pimeloyl-ACP methyl ester carboxylesterase